MDFGEASAIGPDASKQDLTKPVIQPDPSANALDLDAIEQDLADVETALARLESGTYWTSEITGRPLGDDLLAIDPTARRLPSE